MLLLLLTTLSAAGDSHCDAQKDGTYTINLAGSEIGTAAISGTAMSMNFGPAGSASGTFTTSASQGTATLTGTGSIGGLATGTFTGPYSWDTEECSVVTISLAGQSAVLTRAASPSLPSLAGV